MTLADSEDLSGFGECFGDYALVATQAHEKNLTLCSRCSFRKTCTSTLQLIERTRVSSQLRHHFTFAAPVSGVIHLETHIPRAEK
jgi:hypothetical protein